MLLGYNKQGWLFLKIFKQGLPFLFHLCMRTNSFHVNGTTGLLLSGLAIYFVGQDSESLCYFPELLTVCVPSGDWPQAVTPWLLRALVLFVFSLFIKMKKNIILSLGLFWRFDEATCVKCLENHTLSWKLRLAPVVPGANFRWRAWV